MTLQRDASSSLAMERSVPALRDVSRPRGSRHEECERHCVKGLHDLVQTLTDKVAQLERLGSAPAGGAVKPLDTHRRQVTVVFIDLRGFTAFSETAEPEDVLAVLREYHAEMGRLIAAHAGVLERFTGDGLMVFFDDPVSVPNPAERALSMAFDMRDHLGQLTLNWRKLNHDLDFAVGVAQGYATVGPIGFEGRWDYGVIGTVTNLAARLCEEAKPGQILVSRRVFGAVEHVVEAEPIGDLTLKGFLRPVPVFNAIAPKGDAHPPGVRARALIS